MKFEFFQIEDESGRIHSIVPANIQFMSASSGNTKIQFMNSAITVKGTIDEVTKRVEDFVANGHSKKKPK